jgi:hypothetical protein
MTKEQLLAKYNPANARNLSQADLDAMREFTNDQLKELAEAYPNSANRKPYLILFDNNVKEGKQLFPLSTWQNLYNVRKFSNMKNLMAHTFKEVFTVARPQNRVTANRPGSSVGKQTTTARKVVDLSAGEAAAELQANLPSKTPVKAMTARTAPEPSDDKKGAEIAQPAAKAASARATKASKGTKAAAPAAAEKQAALPADQQLANIDDVTDTHVGDLESAGDKGAKAE